MLVPDIIYLIFGIFIFWIFGSFNGINALTQDEVYKYISSNFSRFMSSVVVLFVIGFFVGARLKAFKLLMVLKSSRNQKFHLLESYKESSKFYWRLVSLKVISFLLLLIGFTISVLIYLIIEIISPLFASIVAVIIIACFFLALFYREAVLYKENALPSSAVGKSYKIFRKNFFSVLVTAVMVLLINFIWAMSNSYFPQDAGFLSSLLSLFYLVVVFLISVWMQLFIFNNYDVLKSARTKINSRKK